MPLTEYERPCPIPGHPQDDAPAPSARDSAWARTVAWHLHAPAERLPLPLALLAWPTGWILHETRVAGHDITYAAAATVLAVWLTWWRHQKTSPRPRLAAIEAAILTAAIGGWLAAAVTWGPLAGHGHLLTWAYLAGAAGGYWWLRRHHAVKAARTRRDERAAWIERKAEWHRIALLIGLGDFHLQEITETNLGEKLLLTSAPGSELATRVAASSRAFAERYAHVKGLPYGRVDIRLTDYPGQLVIEVREKEPSVDGPVTHPAIDPASPYADWFPQRRSIRQPIPIGVIPETGEPMQLTLWDKEGGKAIGVYAMTGGGKSNMLDDIREWVTACDDAVLIQLNAAGSGDELTWEPLAAYTAAGLQADDQVLQQRITGALKWTRHLIGDRAETAVHTGDSVFQPTRQDPAVVVMIDEIDETGNIDGASKLLEFLASKQRKAAVCLILAGQRATAAWTGGSGVRINLSTVVTGMLARDSESRHAVGAENEIPDIAEYSRGEAGFFQVWSTRAKRILARGRAFYIGDLRDQQRIVASRDPAARPGLEGAGDIPEAASAPQSQGSASGLRERLARVQAMNEDRPAPVRQHRPVPGVPPQVMPVLMRLLAAPDGTTAPLASQEIGMSLSAAKNYLKALRDAGLAEDPGVGRGARWRLARPQATDPAERKYQTFADLADAAHAGQIPDMTTDQQDLLEQVWQIVHRPALRLIKGGGDGQ